MAERLRAVVRRTTPDAIERVRNGWQLIGHDLPVGRRSVYFAFVIRETVHVHLGFEHGIFMADPDRMLEGAHLGLRKVRFVTFKAGDSIPEEALIRLMLEAARLAAMSRAERLAAAFAAGPSPPHLPRSLREALRLPQVLHPGHVTAIRGGHEARSGSNSCPWCTARRFRATDPGLASILCTLRKDRAADTRSSPLVCSRRTRFPGRKRARPKGPADRVSSPSV
ncbi:MAG: DUF1801 domain-containing protein [Chloroflexota bacterium]